jgi:hypothetical protein
MKQKTPSVIGERFGLQVDIKNYSKSLPIPCLTETCPNPTTEVVDVGLRLALASKQKIVCADIGQYSTMLVRYVNDCVLPI